MTVRDREGRLQRHRSFQAGAGFLKAIEIVQRKAEIAVRVARVRIERNGALEDLPGLLEAAAFEQGYAEQVQGVEIIRDLLQRAPAQHLQIGMPALAIGGDRCRQKRLGLLLELLLQPRILEGAGADGAL